MLVEFSIGNFRSIKKIQTLSLVASPIVSKNKRIDSENVFNSGTGIPLLKSVVIYGANGSGKSNLIKALLSMLVFIRDSFSDEEVAEKISDPFLLDNISKGKPTFYQLIFVLNKKNYRYGFELRKGKVISEWLFGPANKNEVFYFTRENALIKVNKKYFPEGIGLEKNRTKETTLFLNVVDALNGTISKSIKTYFKSKIALNTGITDLGFRKATIEMLEDKKGKKKILEHLALADLGIKDFENVIFDSKNLPKDAPEDMKKEVTENKKIEFLVTKREITTQKGESKLVIEESFENFESEGTKKYFSYIGPIISSLEGGRILIIDEFDSRFHPLLVKKIVQLYNSNIKNRKKAQLVFVTHDTNLLDSNLFRRDQIYFAEKNKRAESEFYSLMNIGGVRNDSSYEKDYIKGKYGAIPFLGDNKLDL